MKENISKRIELIINELGLTKNSFSKAIGLTNNVTIGRILNENRKPSYDILEKIIQTFGNINANWLLSGEGDVFLQDTTLHINTDDHKRKTYKLYTFPELKVEEQSLQYISQKAFKCDSNIGVPLIPISAMAGWGQGDTTIMEYEVEDYYVVPDFKGVDFMLRVKGSSMYPKYNSGDVVACRKLPTSTFIQWNKVYVLDTIQGPLIKRLKKSEDKDCVLIFSDNPAYEPFQLHKSEIRSLAIVIGVIRLE